MALSIFLFRDLSGQRSNTGDELSVWKRNLWLCRNSALLDTLSAQHECITVTFHSVSGASGAFTVPDGPRPREELYRHPLHGHTVICCVQSRSLCFISWNIFFKSLKSLHWRWGWRRWGRRVVLHAFALIFRTVSTQTRLCHNLQTVQSGWALIFRKHPFHQRKKEKVWSHSSWWDLKMMRKCVITDECDKFYDFF